MHCSMMKIYVENPGTVVMNAIELPVNFPGLKLYFWRFYLLENNFSWKNIKHIKYYIQADFLAFNHTSKRLKQSAWRVHYNQICSWQSGYFSDFPQGASLQLQYRSWEQRNEWSGTVWGSKSSAVVTGKGTKHRLVYETQQSFPRMSVNIKTSLFNTF